MDILNKIDSVICEDKELKIGNVYSLAQLEKLGYDFEGESKESGEVISNFYTDDKYTAFEIKPDQWQINKKLKKEIDENVNEDKENEIVSVLQSQGLDSITIEKVLDLIKGKEVNEEEEGMGYQDAKKWEQGVISRDGKVHKSKSGKLSVALDKKGNFIGSFDINKRTGSLLPD